VHGWVVSGLAVLRERKKPWPGSASADGGERVLAAAGETHGCPSHISDPFLGHLDPREVGFNYVPSHPASVAYQHAQSALPALGGC